MTTDRCTRTGCKCKGALPSLDPLRRADDSRLVAAVQALLMRRVLPERVVRHCSWCDRLTVAQDSTCLTCSTKAPAP